MAAALHMNGWVLRAGFVAMSIVAHGMAVLIYLALWWMMPQETLILDQQRSLWRLLLIVGILIGLTALWVVYHNGGLADGTDVNLYVSSMLLVMSAVFLLRQAGG